MRKPKVPNKYNLTPDSIKALRINREKVNEEHFWRNDAAHAWCISENTSKCAADYEFGTYNSFWLGVYDENCKEHSGEIHLHFSAYGGMCEYIFNTFYDFNSIECEIDLQIQEMFLVKINHLIDNGVFIIS